MFSFLSVVYAEHGGIERTTIDVKTGKTLLS
jgi:hypothetical protein